MSDSDGSPQQDDRHHRRSRSRSPVSPGWAGETPAEREEWQLGETAVPVGPPAEPIRAAPNDPEPPALEPGPTGEAAPATQAAAPAALPPGGAPDAQGAAGAAPASHATAPGTPPARWSGSLGPRAPRRGPPPPQHKAGRAPGTAPAPSPATPTPAPPSRTRPRPPSQRRGRGPSAPRRPSARRPASRCRSCSGAWSRRWGTAIGRGGMPAMGARGEVQRATEGGGCAEEADKRQGRAKPRAAAPGDRHKGRARALAATSEGRGTGRAPVQAAAARHTGQARARAAEGGTQGTARGTGMGTRRTRAPAENARALATERGTRDTGRGAGGRELTRARGWGQRGGLGARRGRVTWATMGRQDGARGPVGKGRAEDKGRGAGHPRSQKSGRYGASPLVSSRCRRTTPTTSGSPSTTLTPTWGT